jgi:hypothetical protein
MDRKRPVYGPEDVIAIVNRHRHDWMNDLQVLFGYIQMNRHDRIKEYIGRLSDKLSRESMVSKLTDPDLVAYLYRFPAVCDRLGLEVIPAGEINLTKLGKPGAQAAGWIPPVIDAFAAAAIPEEAETNRLTVTIDRPDGRLSVRFSFAGALHPEQLRESLAPVLEEVRASGAEAAVREEGGNVDVHLLIGAADDRPKG